MTSWRAMHALRGLRTCGLLGLVACRGGSEPTKTPPRAEFHRVAPSAPSGQASAAARATAPPATQSPCSEARVPAAGDPPCYRQPRVIPRAPPGGRLAAGKLLCPPGLVEIPGGLRRTQAAGWAENGRGERSAFPEVLVEQPSFCLGRTEVTRGEMKQQSEPAQASLPAEVGFKAAEAHCKARGLRLPTQQEWGFAAVGATDFIYPWGDELPADGVCWLRGASSEPCAVGTSGHDVTPDGVFDLAGNVVEWVYITTITSPQWWFPYDVMGGAHDSNCLNLILVDHMFRRTVGGINAADQEHGGFRCASNGRPRASLKSAR